MSPGASKAREYILARQGLVRVELVRLAPRDEVLAGRYQGAVGGGGTEPIPAVPVRGQCDRDEVVP